MKVQKVYKVKRNMIESDNMSEQNKKIPEQLLSGEYFKMPKAVRDRFGRPSRYPNPDWRVGKDNEEVFELILVFNKKELEKSKEVK